MKLLLFLLSLFLVSPVMAKDPQCSMIDECMDRAQQGDSDAQYYLGSEFFKSENYKEALVWFLRAADQGHMRAQYNVGSMYSKGQGTVQNFNEAVSWYSLAADQGEPLSMYNLALHFLHGEGTERDTNAAYHWFFKAAEKRFPSAYYNLAVMYYNGIGTEKSHEKAYAWYDLSSLYNIADSEKRKELLGLRLAKNPEKLEKAKQLAQEYRKKYSVTLSKDKEW
jgi:TPR repeat protein